MSMTDEQRAIQRRRDGFLGYPTEQWVAAGVLFVAVLIGLAFCGKRNESGPSSMGACVYASSFVKQRLKSPSTADFGSCGAANHEGRITELGPGRWRVNNYVDAQNGFGATIRQSFVADMESVGTSWKLNNLTMSER